MLCQKCKKNNATLFYKESINGKTKSIALCPECAAEAQKNGELNFETPSIFGHDIFDSDFMSPFAGLGSLFGSMLSPSQSINPSHVAKKCTLCGSTLEDISKNGKVGCAKCYDIFGNEIDGTIKRIHGNVSHNGRVPKCLRNKLDRTKKLESLKKELASAVEIQDFERAAELRDEIKQIESDQQ